LLDYPVTNKLRRKLRPIGGERQQWKLSFHGFLFLYNKSSQAAKAALTAVKLIPHQRN
jgi:hypothetical protein